MRVPPGAGHQVIMKRSRTCHCLVELDDTPKRTRSTSNLDSLQRWLVGARQEQHQEQTQQPNREKQPFSLERRQNFDLASAVRLLQRSSIPEEGGMVAPSNNLLAQSGTATSSRLDSGGSKARSKSLNEITILEHGQFFVRNDDLGYFVGTEQRLRFASASTSSRDDSLHEGDAGYIFDDTGDSSDYFYGVASSDEADDESPLIPIGSGGACKVARIIGRYATPTTVDTDSSGHASDGQALDSGAGDETGSIEDTAAVSYDEGDPVAAPATTSAPSPTSTWIKLRDGEHGTINGRDEDSERLPSCPKLSVKVFSKTGAAATPAESGDCVPTTTTLFLPPTLASSSSTSGPQDGPGREKQHQQRRATVSPPWPTVSSATFGPLGDAAPSDEARLVSSAACGMERLRLSESKPKLPPVIELGLDQIWNGWDAGRVYNDKALERPYYPGAGKV